MRNPRKRSMKIVHSTSPVATLAIVEGIYLPVCTTGTEHDGCGADGECV